MDNINVLDGYSDNEQEKMDLFKDYQRIIWYTLLYTQWMIAGIAIIGYALTNKILLKIIYVINIVTALIVYGMYLLGYLLGGGGPQRIFSELIS
jgi:hypothetical protein